jgi:metallo-beta-lactamase class B
MLFARARRSHICILLGLLLLALGSLPLRAVVLPDWTKPIAPFRIMGNLYYVGSADLAAYLVVTPAGDILINSNLATSPPQIRHSVEQLGFRWNDIKILLISHAHYDHDAGSAEILRETGAQYMVMDADVPAVESGGRISPEPDFPRYPPSKVTRILHDGDTVSLGGSTLVARKTAGHTPGCTTWTMRVSDHGHVYNAVILGSPNINAGTRLVGNPLYPAIATDFAAGFRTLLALPCDLFLGAHGIYFDLKGKVAATRPGAANPFLDPQGYRSYVLQKQKEFEAELAKQEAAKR